ncbi:MAG TPA: HAD hydrolase-like protein, partial [Vicinamibacterales bacterium]
MNSTAFVAFDLDGTLIDSRRDLADSANALIVERGGAPLDVESVTRMVGEGAGVLVRRALAAAGLSADDPAALPRFLELYNERLLVHTRPYDGIPDALDAIGAHATLAV